MTDDSKKFRVITNNEMTQRENNDDKYRHRATISYQTNPLKEQLVSFTNRNTASRFSPQDLLQW